MPIIQDAENQFFVKEQLKKSVRIRTLVFGFVH